MYPFRIALRYLFSKKSRAAVNIISLISAVVVAVASAAIVIVLSVFNGFTDLAQSHLSVLDPNLKIVPLTGKVIAGADSLCSLLEQTSGVSRAMPVVEERGLLVDGGRQQPVVFKGVAEDYSMCSGIDSVIVDGIFTASDAGLNFAGISVGVAMAMNVRPDPEYFLSLYVPRRTGRITPANPATAFRGDSLVVSSVFQVNQPEYDNDKIIIPLSAARGLLDYDDEATAIEVWTLPGADIRAIQGAATAIAGPGCNVLDRIGQQEASFRMIEIEKWVTFMMLVFILVVASFNIISTLGMLILDKRDNISTLRAIGASRRAVRSVFTWQGWLICVIGGVSGIALGVVLVLLQEIFGLIHLNADPTLLTVAAYPVRLAPLDILAAAAVVALVGFIASRATSLFVNTSKS